MAEKAFLSFFPLKFRLHASLILDTIYIPNQYAFTFPCIQLWLASYFLYIIINESLYRIQNFSLDTSIIQTAINVCLVAIRNKNKKIEIANTKSYNQKMAIFSSKLRQTITSELGNCKSRVPQNPPKWINHKQNDITMNFSQQSLRKTD